MDIRLDDKRNYQNIFRSAFSRSLENADYDTFPDYDFWKNQTKRLVSHFRLIYFQSSVTIKLLVILFIKKQKKNIKFRFSMYLRSSCLYVLNPVNKS